MSPEFHAMKMLREELNGVEYPNLEADITQFLIRAQQELAPENHKKFRESLLKVQADENSACFVALSFGDLCGSNTGLKVDFNKFVGSGWKIGFASDRERREAAALGAYNEGEEQSSPEADPSGSAEISPESSNDVSSLSGNESEATPRTSAEIVTEQNPE